MKTAVVRRGDKGIPHPKLVLAACQRMNVSCIAREGDDGIESVRISYDDSDRGSNLVDKVVEEARKLEKVAEFQHPSSVRVGVSIEEGKVRLDFFGSPISWLSGDVDFMSSLIRTIEKKIQEIKGGKYIPSDGAGAVGKVYECSGCGLLVRPLGYLDTSDGYTLMVEVTSDHEEEPVELVRAQTIVRHDTKEVPATRWSEALERKNKNEV